MTEKVKPKVDDCPHCGESFLHDCAYFENDGTVRCPLCDEVTEGPPIMSEKVKPKRKGCDAWVTTCPECESKNTRLHDSPGWGTVLICEDCGHEERVDNNDLPLGSFPDDYPCPKCNTRLLLHSHGNIAGECPKCGWFKPCNCTKCGGEVQYYAKTAHGSPAIFRCRKCGHEVKVVDGG